MAKGIAAQALGGDAINNLEINSVQDAYNKLGLSGNYTPTVNGRPAEMNQRLNDFEQVNFSPAVKGA